MCLLPGRPHRRCPPHDYRVPLTARYDTEHVCDGDTPSLCRRIKGGPLLRSLGEAHVRPLHGFPRVTTFEKKAETDQSECDGDRLSGPFQK
jgi:hypothetical protein